MAIDTTYRSNLWCRPVGCVHQKVAVGIAGQTADGFISQYCFHLEFLAVKDTGRSILYT